MRKFNLNIPGIPDDKAVYAHGSYSDAHCLICGAQMRLEKWRSFIEKIEVPRCEAVLWGGPDGSGQDGIVEIEIRKTIKLLLQFTAS
jgi:NAD-dependent SIR2 family protein deacetylase